MNSSVVGVETLAPRAGRYPYVGRVHDLLTRGHLLESHAVIPLHHGPFRAPNQRRALLEVGAEHLAHVRPVGPRKQPQRRDRSPEPPRSSAEINEMESPVASETSFSVLWALILSLRKRSPGAPDGPPSAGPWGWSPRRAAQVLRIAAKFRPSTFLSCLISRSRCTSAPCIPCSPGLSCGV